MTADPSPRRLDTTVDLLERVRRGDDQALERLYARYLRPLRRWASGRLPRFARGLLDTDDLVQEVLVQTLRRVEQFEPQHDGAFQAYLRRAVLNRIQDEVRRGHRAPPGDSLNEEAEDRSGGGPSPLEEALGSELLTRYEGALERLRPADREAVVARIELGMDWPEVQAVLAKPSIAAAQMAVSRALCRLAEELGHARR